MTHKYLSLAQKFPLTLRFIQLTIYSACVSDRHLKLQMSKTTLLILPPFLNLCLSWSHCIQVTGVCISLGVQTKTYADFYENFCLQPIMLVVLSSEYIQKSVTSQTSTPIFLVSLLGLLASILTTSYSLNTGDKVIFKTFKSDHVTLLLTTTQRLLIWHVIKSKVLKMAWEASKFSPSTPSHEYFSYFISYHTATHSVHFSHTGFLPVPTSVPFCMCSLGLVCLFHRWPQGPLFYYNCPILLSFLPLIFHHNIYQHRTYVYFKMFQLSVSSH